MSLIHPHQRVKFGQEVKRERTHLRKNQSELADAISQENDISCNQGVISKIENGTSGVDLNVLRVVAESLDIDLDQILSGEGTELVGICENPDCSEVEVYLSGDLLAFRPHGHKVKTGGGHCHFGHRLKVACEQCHMDFLQEDRGIVTSSCHHPLYSQEEISRFPKAKYLQEELSRIQQIRDMKLQQKELSTFRDEVRNERLMRKEDFQEFMAPREL